VAAWGMSLVVADTYNHKIKLVDPGARSVRTILGSGRAETVTPSGGPAFFEPGGLSVAGDELYVADTNNHRIVRVNSRTHAWCEVLFDRLSAPRTNEPVTPEPIRTEPVAVAADRDVDLVLDVRLPPNAHLNPEAPWSVRVTCNGTTFAQRTGKSETFPLTVTVAAADLRIDCKWSVEAAFAYCTDGDKGLCIPCNVAWLVPIGSAGTRSRVTLHASFDALA